jgi:hypothetical protein
MNASSHDDEVSQLLELLANLLPLTLIDRKDRLEVEIRLTTRYHEGLAMDARMLNMLETLWIHIYFILHHGAKVILIQYQGGRDRRLTCYNKYGRREENSSTDFFHLPSEDALKVSYAHMFPIFRIHVYVGYRERRWL